VDAVVKVWQIANGATFEEAVMKAGNRVGVSPKFTVDRLGCFIFGGGLPPVPGAPLNMPGFAIFVPEPSTLALGLLGVGTFLLRHRKFGFQ
jgi:hypothetical protein